MKLKTTLFSLAVILVVGNVSGQTMLTTFLGNPSFETPDVTGDAVEFDVAGWAEGGGADTGIINDGQNGGPLAPPPAANGTQIAFLGNGTNFTNLYQDVFINAPVFGSAGVTSYTFTMSFALRNYGPEINGANGTINLGIEDLTGTTASNVFALQRASLNPNGFIDFSVTLPATTVAPGDGIRIYIDKLAGNDLIVVDNARLAANVPEPSTVMLFVAGAALLGCLGVRWRVRLAGSNL